MNKRQYGRGRCMPNNAYNALDPIEGRDSIYKDFRCDNVTSSPSARVSGTGAFGRRQLVMVGAFHTNEEKRITCQSNRIDQWTTIGVRSNRSIDDDFT